MNPTMNNQHAQHDAPPPPYSETDIYSNSGAAPRSPNTTTSSHTGFTPLDDASSTGEVIYTPPLTPRTSSNTHLEPQQFAPQPGATLYFDSRPAPASQPREILVHTVKVQSTSLPDDLPYQNDWAARDVTPQDWATFVNFLLPDHTTRGNEAIIERKLRSEGRSDAGSTSGRSQAEAQLEQMRENGFATARSRSEVEATVSQWNDGFFGPRGISLKLDPDTRMPGAWGSEFEDGEQSQQQREQFRQQQDQSRQQQEQARQQSRQQQEQSQQQQEQARQQQQERDRNPSMFGKFSIDSNGIRYGDTVILDSNGVKINSLTMDSNGISIGKKPQPPGPAGSAQRSFGEASGPAGPTGPTGPTGTAWPTGPRSPAWTFGGGRGWDRRHRGDHHDTRDWHHDRHDRHHDWHHGPHGWHGRRGGRHSEDRGRGWNPDRKDKHDRSPSVSSVSSKSSTSSESSIGSLPDYDDIKDHQLPVYAERLQDWTSQPDQVRTKSDVKALKAELKAIPKGPVDPNFNRKALKAQIKGLHGNWKQIKKAQRQTRKAYRRERRLQRKAEKREYRNQKREMRRAHKEHRRHGGPSYVPPAPPVPPIPPMPAVPVNRAVLPMFPTPPAPPAPPAPPGPTAAPNPPPWSHNWPRGCKGPSQRSSFFFGPDGPLGQRGPFGPNGPLGPHGPLGRGGWGGSWGRGGGCGNGIGTGSWGCAPGNGNPREAPGAWPEDDHESGVASHIPPPGPTSAAKYKAVEQIEKAIDKLITRAADAKEGRGAMEKEIEALSEQMEVMRMEADEAYARELAE